MARALLLLAVCTCVCACAASTSAPAAMPASASSRLLGQPLPSFRRPTIQGGTFATDDTAGRVVVVEFFARYCKPCQRRLPAAERLRREFADVVIVGVSLDETSDAALAQVSRFGLQFPVIHDTGNVLAGRFRVVQLPAVFVVGPDGTVAWVGGGDQPEAALRQAVLAARAP